MGFALESELVEVFSKSLENFLRTGSFGTHIYEVPLGVRTADIVAIGHRSSLTDEQIELLRRSRCVDLMSGAALLARPLSLEGLAKRNWTRVEWLQDRVHRLERLGLVQRSATGEAFVWSELIDVPDEVVAFEAKLHDWREAVNQAAHYAERVTRAWVVMPDAQYGNTLLRDACSDAGVGLVLVKDDGSYIRPVRPRSGTGRLAEIRQTKLSLLWELANNPSKFIF